MGRIFSRIGYDCLFFLFISLLLSDYMSRGWQILGGATGVVCVCVSIAFFGHPWMASKTGFSRGAVVVKITLRKSTLAKQRYNN